MNASMAYEGEPLRFMPPWSVVGHRIGSRILVSHRPSILLGSTDLCCSAATRSVVRITGLSVTECGGSPKESFSFVSIGMLKVETFDSSGDVSVI